MNYSAFVSPRDPGGKCLESVTCWLQGHYRIWKTLYYRFGAYQLEIELLRALFPDGIDRPPRLKSERAQAWTLNELANSYSLSGQPRNAVPLFEASNVPDEKSGNKRGVAIGLGNIADDQLKLGELAAERNLRRSIELCREIKDEFWEAVGHRELGRLLAYRGVFDEAVGELDAAMGLFEKQNATQSICVVWAYRALRALLMGDKSAFTAAQQARTLADAEHYERDIIRAEWLLGAALVAQQDTKGFENTSGLNEAHAHLTEALQRCRRIGMVDHEPNILLAWARWYRAHEMNAKEGHESAKEGRESAKEAQRYA